MASAGAGRGSGDNFGRRGGLGCGEGSVRRGGFAGRKLHNDGEVGGSGLLPPVSDRQREAARTRGARSHSTGSRSKAWKTFRRCSRLFDPAIQRQRAAERAFVVLRAVAADGYAAAAAQLAALGRSTSSKPGSQAS